MVRRDPPQRVMAGPVKKFSFLVPTLLRGNALAGRSCVLRDCPWQALV